MTKTVESNHDVEKVALFELIYQLADDDFIHAYRGSEWLGLAPHIEEDVAFSSINQDTMGHATMLYELLSELGEGEANDLAHGRSVKERRNAVLLELVNGPGTYLEEPRYDWAFTVARNFYYTSWKKAKIESLKQSSYQPLAHIAVKINMELSYHYLHWKTWIIQLFNASEDSRDRMIEASDRVHQEFADVMSLGPMEAKMVSLGFISTQHELWKRWTYLVEPVFQAINLHLPKHFSAQGGQGRMQEHTSDLASALETLSEVYELDRTASW